MARCLIIGGGLAGLSSAVYLSKSGHDVELIETSPKLGGRTYSFLDKKTNTEIDNGQHIMMGSYENTLNFLKIIGADLFPEYQKNLSIEFIAKGGAKYSLNAKNFFYPFNLIKSIIGYKCLTNSEKFSVFRFFLKIFLVSESELKNKNVYEWLKENNHSENLIKNLWEIIGVGALNTKLNQASAILFNNLLQKMFFSGNKASTIVLPKIPLSKLFVQPCMDYFNKNGIQYSVSEKIEEMEFQDSRAVCVLSENRKITDFDHLILAIPSFAIPNIKANQQILNEKILSMETSSIITVHLWIKEKIFDEKFIGLLNSKLHWIFANEGHYSIVISSADDILDRTPEEIFELVLKELDLYFPQFNAQSISSYKVIKEKRATLKCSIKNESIRSNIKSEYSNLHFVGDWTNTGLPGTIEGAILSAKRVSRQIN